MSLVVKGCEYEKGELVLSFLKTIYLLNQQNLTEETSHERIVCVEGKIYALVKSSNARAK